MSIEMYSLHRDKTLMFSTTSRMALGATYPGIQYVKGQGMKLTTHTTPSAKFRNDWLYTSTCMSWW